MHIAEDVLQMLFIIIIIIIIFVGIYLSVHAGVSVLHIFAGKRLFTVSATKD